MVLWKGPPGTPTSRIAEFPQWCIWGCSSPQGNRPTTECTAIPKEATGLRGPVTERNWGLVSNRTINHLIPPPITEQSPKQNTTLTAPRMTTTKRESHLGLPVPRIPQKWNTGKLADHRSYFRKRRSSYKSDITKDYFPCGSLQNYYLVSSD